MGFLMTSQGKCRVIKCLVMECEEEADGMLTNRSGKDDRTGALFSNIINDGQLGGERRRSSGLSYRNGIINSQSRFEMVSYHKIMCSMKRLLNWSKYKEVILRYKNNNVEIRQEN